MRLSLAAEDLFIVPPKWFFVKPYFLEAFELSELGPLQASQCQLVFSASIGSFQGLPAEALEVILLPQRLALEYNTTPPASCQHFLTGFFKKLQVAALKSDRSLFFAATVRMSRQWFQTLYLLSRKAPRPPSEDADMELGFSFSLPVSSRAGSARLQQPAWAATRSDQWVWGPAHYNRHLQGRSAP